MKAIGMLLMVLFAPMAAEAICGVDEIRLLSGGEELGCYGEVVPGEPLLLDVVIQLNLPFDRIAEASFRLRDWPEDPAPQQGSIVAHWFSDTATGDLRDGMTLTWDEPMERVLLHGQEWFFHIGTIEVLSLDPGWLAEALEVEFVWDDCHVVNFWGDRIELYPGLFNFNESYSDCWSWIADPPDGWFYFARHFFPPNGSLVPKDFDLEFEAYSAGCYGLIGLLQVEILLNGESVHQIEFGNGFPYVAEQIELPISVEAIEIGAPVEVTVRVRPDDSFPWDIYELTYILDDTPVLPASLSVVKSLY